MPLGRQAKLVSSKQQSLVLQHVATTRHPKRARVIVLLSFRAGLRAKEIASLTWARVMDADGEVCEEIAPEDRASKGRGGRRVPLHKTLRQALTDLQAIRGGQTRLDRPVVYPERGRGMSAATVTSWFGRLYCSIGLVGCSSHTGQRTFITSAARKIVGWSARGHPSMWSLNLSSREGSLLVGRAGIEPAAT
ncbi:MAG: tyrosine-type recombinase/integrase [Gammaproteobacteria bacterium]|nr:tyrosine-type recombinase/integrase [Gammaproteobacteria bacterium]